MAVSKRLRYEIFRRDDYACRYCGARAPEAQLTVDHVIPVTLGGEDEPANLVTACVDCNAGKSSSSPDQPLVEGVSADALRWAKAMREAAEIQLDERGAVQAYRDAFADCWADWNFGVDKLPVPLPDGWPDSLEQFYRAGLDGLTLLDLVGVAMRSQASPEKTFRYFCGCCWRALRERQEIARDLIAKDHADTEETS